MEVATEMQENKKMERLKKWGIAWALFMAIIVAPAFFCASAIEGEGFSTSVDLVGGSLRDFGIPWFIAIVMALPVTVVAKIIPVGASWIVMLLILMPVYLAIIVPVVFCAYAELPFYRKMKSKIDPFWYEKENDGVLVKAAIRGYPFSAFAVITVLVSLIGILFVMPNIRLPIADNWSGKVYISDARGRLTPIDVVLDLKFFNPGLVTDSKPGVKNPALYLEFSGKDVDKIKAMGINDNFIKDRHAERTYYPNNLCEIVKARAQLDKSPYGISLPYFVKNYYLDTRDNVAPRSYSNDLGCPKIMHFGISDFESAQFAINGPGENYLVANLQRDSRWNWIEKMIVANKFIKNPQGVLEETRFGYQ